MSKKVCFDDIVGLENAKKVLKDLALQVFIPGLIDGKWKARSGVLLYGPSGTGKTMLTEAIASEAKAELICMQTSWLTGGSEQLKTMFKKVSEKPTVLVFESLEGIGKDHLGKDTRKFLAEFLAQLDALFKYEAQVLVIGVSNEPWDIDNGVRRRFAPRLYISPPSESAKADLFAKLIEPICKRTFGNPNPHYFNRSDCKRLAAKCECFSASDIEDVIKEAEREPQRHLVKATHFMSVKATGFVMDEEGEDMKWTPVHPSSKRAIAKSWLEIDSSQIIETPMRHEDVFRSIERAVPTPLEDLSKFIEYTAEFGQEG